MDYSDVWLMSEDEAYEAFKRHRWPDTDGQPICPKCQWTQIWHLSTRRVFKCKGCHWQFSATSGTPFAHRKLSYRRMFAALLSFVNGARGTPALRVARDSTMDQKSAFALMHKAREAMAFEQFGRKLQGEVEVDGIHFVQHRRPPNEHWNWRKGRDTLKHCGIVMRERGGDTLTFVVRRESEGVPLVFKHIDPSATVYFDQGLHWAVDEIVHHFKQVEYLNHSMFRADPWHVSTNCAESLNDRIRRSSHVYTRITGSYVDLYLAEAAWRRDRRRESNGAQFARLLRMMCSMPVSRRFGNYVRVPKPKPEPPFTPRARRTY